MSENSRQVAELLKKLEGVEKSVTSIREGFQAIFVNDDEGAALRKAVREERAWLALFEEWRREHGKKGRTAADLYDLVVNHALICDLAEIDDPANRSSGVVRLGRFLNRRSGQAAGDYRMVRWSKSGRSYRYAILGKNDPDPVVRS